MACRLLCQFLIHIIMLYNYRSFMIVLVPFRSRPLLRSARRSGWLSSLLNSCPVRRVDPIVEVAYSRKKSHGARIKFPIFFSELNEFVESSKSNVAKRQTGQRILDGEVSSRVVPSEKQIPSWAIVQPPAASDQDE